MVFFINIIWHDTGSTLVVGDKNLTNSILNNHILQKGPWNQGYTRYLSGIYIIS